MNFQQVRQAKGNKDEKGYPQKIDMYGTLVEIGGVYFNTNQTECSRCVIIDDAGEKHRVILMKTIPATRFLNTRQGFSLYSFDGTYQNNPYIGYSGFWIDNPRTQSQTPQNAPQSTNSGQGVSNTPDISNFAERLVSAIENLVDKKLDERFEDKYNLKDPDFPNEPSNAPDSDIPF